jgi:hypothetical protein
MRMGQIPHHPMLAQRSRAPLPSPVGQFFVGGRVRVQALASVHGFGDAVLVALDRDIARDYTLGAERDRLTELGGRLEFVRGQELLSRFLPSPLAIGVA